MVWSEHLIAAFHRVKFSWPIFLLYILSTQEFLYLMMSAYGIWKSLGIALIIFHTKDSDNEFQVLVVYACLLY